MNDTLLRASGRFLILAALSFGMLFLMMAVCSCGTKSHDQQSQQPATQKTTDDGPAVERVQPERCNG